MAGYFERIIDGLVYELFLPDELAAAGSEFATLLAREALPTLRELGDEPLAALRRVYERLDAPTHPVAKNVFFLHSIAVVRVIEGQCGGALTPSPAPGYPLGHAGTGTADRTDQRDEASFDCVAGVGSGRPCC